MILENRTWTQTLASICLAATLVGCGANYKALESSSTKDNQQAGQEPSQGTPPASGPSWENLKVNGSLDSGRFTGRQVLSLDKHTKELVVTMPMLANPDIDFLGAIEVGLPQVPGLRIRIEPLPGGGSNVIVRIPLTSLIRGVDFPSPAVLPNGDPLPAVASGHMPAWAIQLPKIKDFDVRLYLDVASVAFFVPTKFDPMFSITAWIRNEDRSRTWGSFSTVPAKGSFDGGFFISIQLPDDIARAIDDLL